MLFFGIRSSAQDLQIKGRISDEKNESIEFAQLNFLRIATDSIYSTRTQRDGFFRLKVPSDRYRLQVFFLGSLLKEEQININSDTVLGTIQVNRTLSLDSIVVQHSRNVLEQKIDRIVFNVEKSIAGQGMDALEALSYAPMVQVNGGNISMIGRSGVSVMVNDRMLNLSGNDIVDYLKTLRSDNISKIEVITTPPAKYDAQGNGGMINIIMKKNPNMGLSGSVSATYTRRSKNGLSNNASLNYQNERTRLTAMLRRSGISSLSKGYSNIIGDQGLLTQYKVSSSNGSIGGSLNLDQMLSNRSNIGFTLDYVNTEIDRSRRTELDYVTIDKNDSTMLTNSEEDSDNRTLIASGYYDLRLDSVGKKLSVIANYLSTDPKSNIDFRTDNLTYQREYFINTDNSLKYQIYSGQIDLSLPYQWAYIEVGTKYTRFNNRSELKYYDVIDHVHSIDPNKSNDFDYEEDNMAIYVSATRNINKFWSAKLGLRYELTHLKGYSRTLDQTNKKDYGNVFPTVYVSYRPDQKNTYSLSYSRRINRPPFGQLNPFRTYSNPYTYYVGNQELEPSYSDNLDIGYNFNSKLSFFLTARSWNNGNAYLATFENGYQINRQENYIDQRSLGAYAYYSNNIFRFWNSTTSINASYMDSKTDIEEAIGLRGMNASLSSNNTFSLNKSKTLNIFANYMHFFGNRSGNIENYSNANFTLGGRATFLNRTLNISMFMADIFKQEYSRGKGLYRNYYQQYGNYTDVRRFAVSVTYTFGNRKVKAVSKDNKFSEKDRID